jgi:hypothetical protein
MGKCSNEVASAAEASRMTSVAVSREEMDCSRETRQMWQVQQRDGKVHKKVLQRDAVVN